MSGTLRKSYRQLLAGAKYESRIAPKMRQHRMGAAETERWSGPTPTRAVQLATELGDDVEQPKRAEQSGDRLAKQVARSADADPAADI